MPEPPIVLASSSPRRKQLLEMLRIPFRVVPPDVDETRHPGEAPEPYVRRLAHAKAQAVARQERRALVLAADTTVVLDGELFAKPLDAADAVAMLGRLQGRTHHVLSAVAVAGDGRAARQGRRVCDPGVGGAAGRAGGRRLLRGDGPAAAAGAGPAGALRAGLPLHAINCDQIICLGFLRKDV